MKQQNYGFVPLENKINQVLKPIFLGRKDNFIIINNLNKNWQKIAGEKCWQFCFPKKIKFEKNKKANGILTIIAHNSAVAFYLEASNNQILENIAAYYGYKIISDIRIIQEPKIFGLQPVIYAKEINEEQQALIETATKTITHDGLRSILQELGKAILGKH